MPATTKRRSAKKTVSPVISPAAKVTYLLRTCSKDMTSYNDFKWPKSGPVTCSDWRATPTCGHGLHGLLHGQGDASLMDWSDEAKWLVVAVDASTVVKIDSAKVKVPGGDVVFCGKREVAIAKLLELDTEASPSTVPCGQASASGDYGQASASGQRGQASASGQRGQASASGYQGQASASGDYGQASASGQRGQASASGQRGQASASGDYGQASASGDYGQASASGQRGQASASGYQGQASASGQRGQASASGQRGQASASGDYGQASALRGRARAGDLGIILLFKHDATANRDRVIVGYVGENGIEAGKWYKLNDAGTIVESPAGDSWFDGFAAAPFECAADAKTLKVAAVKS